MEQHSIDDGDIRNRKRLRDGSTESVSQLAGPDSSVQYANSSGLDDVKADSLDNDDCGVQSEEPPFDVPEAKRIHVDLFSILDDSDEPTIQGLDSVIRSFEEEILVHSGLASVETEVTTVVDGSQPDLGYLLEASDDELGLPPTFSSEKEKFSGELLSAETSGSGAVSFGDILGFEDNFSAYDSFDMGLTDGPVSHCYYETGDFVNLGGLFNYSDDSYVPAEISGVQWQRESLSAL